MKIAVIGSRKIAVPDLGKYMPEETNEIVSGGAKDVDSSAKKYAIAHGIKLTKFLPEYARYGKSALLKRNILIIQYANMVDFAEPKIHANIIEKFVGQITPKGNNRY